MTWGATETQDVGSGPGLEVEVREEQRMRPEKARELHKCSPEVASPDRSQRCYGLESASLLWSHLLGQEVPRIMEQRLPHCGGP